MYTSFPSTTISNCYHSILLFIIPPFPSTSNTTQSKRGALWSRGPLVVPSFSVILKFRISGKGRTFYGDGIALWFVQQPYYTEGEVHGFQEHYTGDSVVIKSSDDRLI